MAGKTGADAIFKLVHRCLIVLTKYDAKLRALVDAAHTAGDISDAQRTAVVAFLDGLAVLNTIFQILAEFNSPF